MTATLEHVHSFDVQRQHRQLAQRFWSDKTFFDDSCGTRRNHIHTPPPISSLQVILRHRCPQQELGTSFSGYRGDEIMLASSVFPKSLRFWPPDRTATKPQSSSLSARHYRKQVHMTRLHGSVRRMSLGGKSVLRYSYSSNETGSLRRRACSTEPPSQGTATADVFV